MDSSSVLAAEHAAQSWPALGDHRGFFRAFRGRAARPDLVCLAAVSEAHAAIERWTVRGLGLTEAAAAMQVVGGRRVRDADPGGRRARRHDEETGLAGEHGALAIPGRRMGLHIRPTQANVPTFAAQICCAATGPGRVVAAVASEQGACWPECANDPGLGEAARATRDDGPHAAVAKALARAV